MKANDAAVRRFLSERVKEGTCSCCGSKSWSYDDTLFEVREFHGGSLVAGGGVPIMPLLVLTCDTCGSVRFFNALVAGLVDKEGQPTDG